MSNEADDLWIGHKLKKDPNGIEEATAMTRDEFHTACNSWDIAGVRRTARWMRSIGDAMSELADEAERYDRRR